jgi:hypothetical protein
VAPVPPSQALALVKAITQRFHGPRVSQPKQVALEYRRPRRAAPPAVDNQHRPPACSHRVFHEPVKGPSGRIDAHAVEIHVPLNGKMTAVQPAENFWEEPTNRRPPRIRRCGGETNPSPVSTSDLKPTDSASASGSSTRSGRFSGGGHAAPHARSLVQGRHIGHGRLEQGIFFSRCRRPGWGPGEMDFRQTDLFQVQPFSARAAKGRFPNWMQGAASWHLLQLRTADRLTGTRVRSTPDRVTKVVAENIPSGLTAAIAEKIGQNLPVVERQGRGQAAGGEDTGRFGIIRGHGHAVRPLRRILS